MHTNFLKILLYFSLLLEFCRAQVIRYDDKNIQYFGRWKYTNQSANIWSGSYFKANIQGNTQIVLKLNKPTTLLIQLDDTPPSEVKTNGTLPIETNGASIISVTAINKDTIWLDSILLSTAEKLGQINQQKQPPELVEFVGHDLTLGLGTSKSIMTSFPWLVSNLLQIERSQIAFPGAWLMDHDNVFGMETEYFRWSSDQSRYTEPAAVVVLLGAYDKYKAVYAGRLVHFLKRIRSYYPKSAVLVLSEPLGLLYKESQDAVNEINSGGGGDQNVYFIDTTSWVRYGSAYIDPSHLSDMGQEQFARNFAPLLKAKVANPPQQFPGPKRNVNLPYDWLTMDIGDETSIGLVGSVSFDSTRAFTLWGSGMDIGDTRDAFRFVYQTLSANGSIEVTVESHSAFASCAKAGIMLRENLSPSSPFVMLGLSPADGIFVQARQFNETQLFIKRKLAPPYRLRLIRKGDKWMTQIATQQQNLWETLAENTIRMARDVYLGLAVTSCDRSVVSVAKFANVVLQGGVNGGFYYRPLIIQQPS